MILRTIQVSEETYDAIKDQLGEDESVDIQDFEDLIGKKWFIRTVTFHLVGKIEAITGHFFQLSGASWIADSGRFMGAIKDGTLSEVEPVGQALVNIQSITDMFPWKHKLPTKQK
jgi:hypothetical protein